MKYKNYPNSIEVPSRMARKRARREVFVHNKKAKAVERKSLRAERKSSQE